MAKDFYTKEFGKAFIFKKIRPYIRSFFLRAGYEDVPYSMFGWMFYASIILTYIGYMVVIFPRLSGMLPGTVFIVTFVSWVAMLVIILSLIIVYLYFNLTIQIYKRTKEIESILPEYLQVVSSNLKGGLSFEKSLWNAINPEFGIIAKEITMVSKKVMTGNDLTDALKEFVEKYDSPLLMRSFDLIIGEVESGGQVAMIVDKVIENVRKTRMLKEEMAASTLAYMIFIGAIVILIAPALFALSYNLLNIMLGFSSQLSGVSMQGLPSAFSSSSISASDFRGFSVLALLTIALFSSMLLSIIDKGDIKGGIKYIPAFMISSLFFYFVFMIVIGAVFGGLS